MLPLTLQDSIHMQPNIKKSMTLPVAHYMKRTPIDNMKNVRDVPVLLNGGKMSTFPFINLCKESVHLSLCRKKQMPHQ